MTNFKKFLSDINTDALNQLDFFTASPNSSLSADTIEYFKTRYLSKTGTLKLFRVLFTDDEIELAKQLKTPELKVGNKCTHYSLRTTSWTKSFKHAVQFMEGGFEVDNGNTAVIIESNASYDDVVLDLDDLSKIEKQHIIHEDQKEVILCSGSINAKIIKIVREDEFYN